MIITQIILGGFIVACSCSCICGTSVAGGSWLFGGGGTRWVGVGGTNVRHRSSRQGGIADAPVAAAAALKVALSRHFLGSESVGRNYEKRKT